jgi:hypothetical protein
MIYKIIKTYSYQMGAVIEADSEEEAMQLIENNQGEYEWEEENGGEHNLDSVGCQIGYDVDGEPAENVDDVDVWEYPY